MALPQRPTPPRSRVITALLVSLGVHLLLLPFVARDAVFHMPSHPRQVVSLVSTPRSQVQHAQAGAPGQTPRAGQSSPELQPKLPPTPQELVKPEPQKVEGQIVSLGRPEDERAPDKPTKYLSEFDSRVAKETRAKETSAFFKNALSKVQKEGRDTEKDKRPPKPAPAPKPAAGEGGEGGGAQAMQARQEAELPDRARRDPLHVQESSDGTLQNRDANDALRGGGKRVAMANPGNAAAPSSNGPGQPGRAAGAPGTRNPLDLHLDSTAVAESLGPVAGGPMPDDLRGVTEGDETLLNSRGFKYAGFLNRVKETVGRIWTQKVQDEAARRDPTGQLYSYKDRRTVVEFTLDRAGEITEVKVNSSCGVEYLDRTAVDAFKRAERFPNPPAGLFDEHGVSRQTFAFTLLAATGGMKLQVGPAYLPGSPAARGF